MLNEQLPADAGEEKADHDFDVISHENCDYDNPEKGINIDVEETISSIFGGNNEVGCV